MAVQTLSWMKPTLLAGALALGGTGAALAAAPGPTEQAEIVALHAASTTPTAAIRAAEAHTGGKALGFGYEKDAAANAYEVTVGSPSGLRMVRIDPVQGTVVNVENQPANALAADGLPQAALRSAETAPTSLAAAVAAAEQAGHGRALEANYVASQGTMRIDVDIAQSGKIVSYRVDPASGQATLASAGENEAQEAAGAGAGESAQDTD